MRINPGQRLSDVGARGDHAEHLVCATTSAELGGAETSLLTLLRALRRKAPRWAISIVAPDEGPLLGCCREAGIEVRVLPYPAGLAALGEPGVRLDSLASLTRAALAIKPYVQQLGTTLNQLGATIVHSNGIKAHATAAVAAPKGARVIWHVHDYLGNRRATAPLLQLFSSRPAAIVANSDSVRQDVIDTLGRPAVVHRIYNAVDLSVFCPTGHTFDLAKASGLGPDDGFVRIGLVATFAHWKGHRIFIDALAQVSADLPVRGYVIGGPIYQTADSQGTLDELQRYAAEKGLGDRVGFTGHLSDVASAMRALDVIVHASTRPEPFGMAIAEGLASGRAVVAVREGGARELFVDGVEALGHNMGDADDLARQLRRVVSDAALRASLGRAARAAAEQRFSPDRMADEFLQIYAA